MAEQRGVSMASIGECVSALVGGQKSGKFTDEGHRFDIRVRLKEGERNSLGDLRKIYVPNNRGELVNLLDVVTVKPVSTLFSVTRVNRERAINMYASPAVGFTQQQAIDAAMKIAKETLPSGYTAVLSGTSQTSQESFQGLFFALIIGIFVSYLILASQFNSYIDPITILLALPFSFSGAIIALFITGNSINLFSFIGIILLMGLVKKNSILLVEFTNQMRDKGLPVREALLAACPIRLRPIIMTSLATIAAALPPALALGPGSETRVPMAVAVLGGIVVSTILTLVVVPCVYSLFARSSRERIVFEDELPVTLDVAVPQGSGKRDSSVKRKRK
jgi:HAE1 family hydrophobic/amphiphilic exporter-1